MTYKVWERQLKKEIKKLPKEERERIAEYYREMYDELISGGMNEESALTELGSPEKCAAQAIAEGEQNVFPTEIKPKTKVSVAELFGLFFFSLFLGLPLVAIGVSLIISFAAVVVSGAAISLAGIVFAFASFYFGFSRISILAYAGIGIAACGAGMLLFVGFFLLTKYTAIAFKNLLKTIYVRR